jgi:hypothetical protein
MPWFNSYYCTDTFMVQEPVLLPSCGYGLVWLVRHAAYPFYIGTIHMSDHRTGFPAVPAIVPILSEAPLA